MRLLPFLALLALPGAIEAADRADLLVGHFTNEEQVYFDKEAGRQGPPWFALSISREGDRLAIAEPDAFGAIHDPAHLATVRFENHMLVLDYGACQRIYREEGEALVASGKRGTCRAPASITRISPFAIEMTYPDGSIAELRRARPVACWVAIRKAVPKTDGGDDWYFKRGVTLHDQGGRAAVGGGDSGVDPLVIRLRNVTWDRGSTNQPAVTLYVHKPDSPNRAEAYSWAAPDSGRIGINLRWMQAGCSIGQAIPSPVSAKPSKP
jgi:hypothetical protein